MNLNTTRVCSLPSYPGVGGHGPVVMSYLGDQQPLLAACGSYEKHDKSCYQLSPDLSWKPFQALLHDHCSYPYTTRSSYITDLGWFILGLENGCCGSYCNDTIISSELLTFQLEWIETPVMSPYDRDFPFGTCLVSINSSSVIVTGGRNGDGILTSTWMLDLTDFTWTQLEDMPGPRYQHGCITTAAGDLIIAGGSDGSDISSVYIYNLLSNTWIQAGDLPAGMNYFNYPVMFLWNNLPILLEHYSSNIWIMEQDGDWKRLESTMGGSFRGGSDLATMVPAGLFAC